MRPFIIKIKREQYHIDKSIPFIFWGVGSYDIEWGDGCSNKVRTKTIFPLEIHNTYIPNLVDNLYQ